MNEIRYNLYQISLDWNQTLDGLKLYAPRNDDNNNGNKDDGSGNKTWIIKFNFKTPFKSTSKSLVIDNTNEHVDDDQILSPHSLNVADLERVKRESLFLLSSHYEENSDIHLNLYKCRNKQAIPIFINEPSTIIAYTLSSLEYHCAMNNIATEKIRSCRQRGEPTVDELEEMIQEAQVNKYQNIERELEIRSESNQGKLHYESDKLHPIPEHKNDVDNEKNIISIQDEIDLNELLYHIPKIKHVSKMEYIDQKKEYELQLKKHGKYVHFDNQAPTLKLQFIDKTESVTTTFSCHVYYPNQFRALRRRLLNDLIDSDFIQSLSRCQSWNATGGKKGTFAKSLDDRFVLKFVEHNELKMFLDKAPSYFEYMTNVIFKNYPSILIPILGVYQLWWIKTTKQQLLKKYIIVMPNLWYSKNIHQKFDLKGNLRNRYVEDEQEEEKKSLNDKKVKLDRNFIEEMNGLPMILKDNFKQFLYKAIHNDTLFLFKSRVIDYSFLVGINQCDNELVCGIIDYLRTYSLAEKIEKHAKSMVAKEQPTVAPPDDYQKRFRDAMDRYFMSAPNRKTKLSKQMIMKITTI